jgi:hypothetical protein
MSVLEEHSAPAPSGTYRLRQDNHLSLVQVDRDRLCEEGVRDGDRSTRALCCEVAENCDLEGMGQGAYRGQHLVEDVSQLRCPQLVHSAALPPCSGVLEGLVRAVKQRLRG